jgi:hemoglobin
MLKHDIRNDEDVRKLVHTFYKKVQGDDRLGYIFNDYANVDWDTHLPKMVDFWSNLLFQTRRYKGRPLQKHFPLPIEKQDFQLWFGLFEKTVDELFKGERADHAKEMAARIASSFSIRMEMEGKFE